MDFRPFSRPSSKLRFSRLALAVVFFVVGLVSFALNAVEPAEKVNFSFQIRPLLADRCFKCHGPDDKARKGKLRLDLAESAYAIRDAEKREAAVVPSHPERSQLCWRISTTNEDDRMPPAASNLSLSSEEKELLQRWVKQGAEYTPHWAYIPIQKPSPPKLADDSPAQNPIDAFVLAKLQRENLKPSPEATRETLIRRLSFDLRGLPPTLEEIDAFLADKSRDAYERLIEKELASPAYGEQQASLWLDLARFADTYGYQSDVDRDFSPWRDWVIRAFNQNLPYDQFVLWQLAGDLLPAPTRDQILATAFNRLHRQTNEGGSVEEEFRAEYVADRVATAGTSFLGLTLGCAKCHDHKYDPITQKDFYRMSAFFNNIDECGLYSHFTRATPTPTLLLYAEDQEARHEKLKAEIAAKEAALALLARQTESPANARSSIPRPEPSARYSFEEISKESTPDNFGSNAAQLVDGPSLVSGKAGRAMLFSGDNYVVCKGAGAFNRTMPFSFGLWVKPAEYQPRAVIFHRSRSWTDSGSRGYELLLEDGRPSFSLIHFWPGNAIKVQAKTVLPTNEWSHLAITYDGSSHANGLQLYLNGEQLEVEAVRDRLYKDILHRAQWGDAEVGSIELTLAGRFRDSGFKNGAIDEFEIFDHCLTPWEAKLVAARTGGAGKEAVPPSDKELREWVLRHENTNYMAACAELRKLREEENTFANDIPEIMVMNELPTRRPTFVLKRGAYDARGEPVEPGVPETILPFGKDLPKNRLGLAKWMTARQNPLTARVEVNRVWRSHFGHGLVESDEDFGTQGRLPTNPELLDWLAATFMDSGWDIKALHKLIVSSAIYKQSSSAGPELLAKDPENRLLARGPRHRLRAEEIRDNALVVSGLLATRIGGPSAKPYQPEGLWEESGTGKHYERDKVEGLYRRSLYTFWRRTAPPPSMLIFDAPTREVCTARRDTTATPLQSLVLLNDPQFVEAARVLAERVLKGNADDLDARIRTAFRLMTGREPKDRELEVLRGLYEEQLNLFSAEPAAAEDYLKIGERTYDKALPLPALAATTVLASTLMNMDEFVVER